MVFEWTLGSEIWVEVETLRDLYTLESLEIQKNHLTCHESLQVVGYLPYQLVWNIYSINTRWWQLIFFNFHLGKIPILTNIFQGGWNHQLTDRWGPIWEVPLWRLDMSRENPENTPFAN